jgi:hypothetical protein
LREDLKSRLQDFRKHETYFRIFASPFEVDVEAVSEKFQTDLIVELQSRKEMKSKFLNVFLLKFYKRYLPKNNLPQLCRQVIRVSTLFLSSYVRDQLL